MNGKVIKNSIKNRSISLTNTDDLNNFGDGICLWDGDSVPRNAPSANTNGIMIALPTNTGCMQIVFSTSSQEIKIRSRTYSQWRTWSTVPMS